MNAMKNKIKSQRGASITFALLLFLVCAVISGVVIVAATAAAGRMSEQADMDERYYAVTAVADRLNQVFDGKEVIVTYDIEAKKPKVDSFKVKYSDGTETGIPTILKTASIDAVQAVLLEESVIEPVQVKYPKSGNVTCTVDRKMQNDGRMEYTISAWTKKSETDTSGKYTVVISLSPNLPSSATETAKDGQATVKWKFLGARKVSATQKKTEDG